MTDGKPGTTGHIDQVFFFQVYHSSSIVGNELDDLIGPYSAKIFNFNLFVCFKNTTTNMFAFSNQARK